MDAIYRRKYLLRDPQVVVEAVERDKVSRRQLRSLVVKIEAVDFVEHERLRRETDKRTGESQSFPRAPRRWIRNSAVQPEQFLNPGRTDRDSPTPVREPAASR